MNMYSLYYFLVISIFKHSFKHTFIYDIFKTILLLRIFIVYWKKHFKRSDNMVKSNIVGFFNLSWILQYLFGIEPTTLLCSLSNH